jgi:hypothetical protein
LSPRCYSTPCVSDEPDSETLKFENSAYYDPDSKIILPMDFPYKKPVSLLKSDFCFEKHRK